MRRALSGRHTSRSSCFRGSPPDAIASPDTATLLVGRRAAFERMVARTVAAWCAQRRHTHGRVCLDLSRVRAQVPHGCGRTGRGASVARAHGRHARRGQRPRPAPEVRPQLAAPAIAPPGAPLTHMSTPRRARIGARWCASSPCVLLLPASRIVGHISDTRGHCNLVVREVTATVSLRIV